MSPARLRQRASGLCPRALTIPAIEKMEGEEVHLVRPPTVHFEAADPSMQMAQVAALATLEPHRHLLSIMHLYMIMLRDISTIPHNTTSIRMWDITLHNIMPTRHLVQDLVHHLCLLTHIIKRHTIHINNLLPSHLITLPIQRHHLVLRHILLSTLWDIDPSMAGPLTRISQQCNLRLSCQFHPSRLNKIRPILWVHPRCNHHLHSINLSFIHRMRILIR